MNSIEMMLSQVADELSWLPRPPVFLGGATIFLFLDPLGRSQLRPTHDVDCIVPEVTTQRAWWSLEAQLREKGWQPVPMGPICRYLSPKGITVDLMAHDPRVLGFAGRWYGEAVEHAQTRRLTTGRSVLVPTPALLMACKLEAWNDRGRADPYASKDLEDIVALLDGCLELHESLADADRILQSFVSTMLEEIRMSQNLLDVVLGQLPVGGDVAARERRLLDTIQKIVVCGNSRS